MRCMIAVLSVMAMSMPAFALTGKQEGGSQNCGKNTQGDFITYNNSSKVFVDHCLN